MNNLLDFIVSPVEDFERNFISTSTLRKTVDGTKALFHVDSIKDANTRLILSVMVGDPRFEAIAMSREQILEEIKKPEWGGTAETEEADLGNFSTEQAILINKLKTEQDDVLFQIDIVSNAKGDGLVYPMNLKTYSVLQTQYTKAMMKYTALIEAGVTPEEAVAQCLVAFHDSSVTLHDSYNMTETQQLVSDVTTAIAYREAKLDIFITRTSMATTMEELALCETEVFSEQEQSYIDTIIAGAME